MQSAKATPTFPHLNFRPINHLPLFVSASGSTKNQQLITPLQPLILIRSSLATFLSFISQRHHWVDSHRPPRREIASGYRNEREKRKHNREGQRVKHAHAIEQPVVLMRYKVKAASRNAAQSQRDSHARCQPGKAQGASFAQSKPVDSFWARS